MEKVFINIDKSLKRRRRKVLIMYFTPIYDSFIISRSLEKLFEVVIGNKTEAILYEWNN